MQNLLHILFLTTIGSLSWCTLATITSQQTLLDKMCNNKENVMLALPDSCSDFVICIDGQAILTSCGLNLHFNELMGHCDAPEVVNCALYSHLPIQINNKKELFDNRVIVHKSNSPIEKTSPSLFIPKPQFPEEAIADPKFSKNCQSLTHGMLLPKPESCQHFYVCLLKRAYRRTCPDGLHFSATHAVCMEPKIAKCLKADHETTIKNPFDAHIEKYTLAGVTDDEINIKTEQLLNGKPMYYSGEDIPVNILAQQNTESSTNLLHDLEQTFGLSESKRLPSQQLDYYNEFKKLTSPFNTHLQLSSLKEHNLKKQPIVMENDAFGDVKNVLPPIIPINFFMKQPAFAIQNIPKQFQTNLKVVQKEPIQYSQNDLKQTLPPLTLDYSHAISTFNDQINSHPREESTKKEYQMMVPLPNSENIMNHPILKQSQSEISQIGTHTGQFLSQMNSLLDDKITDLPIWEQQELTNNLQLGMAKYSPNEHGQMSNSVTSIPAFIGENVNTQSIQTGKSQLESENAHKESTNTGICYNLLDGTLVPHRFDCTKYFTCKNGYATGEMCPFKLHYNQLEQRCDHPLNAKCSLPKQ